MKDRRGVGAFFFKPKGVEGLAWRFRRQWMLAGLVFYAVVLLLMAVFGIFTYPERQLVQALDLQLQNAASRAEARHSAILAQSHRFSKQVLKELERMDSLPPAKGLQNRPEALLALQQSLYPYLSAMIWIAPGSGGFFVLDATTNTSASREGSSRTGMYMRMANIGSYSAQNLEYLVYFRGIPQVAREQGIELHNRWELEFSLEDLPGGDRLGAWTEKRAIDQAFWSEAFLLPDTWEKVSLMSMPIVDGQGRIIGLCGVEIAAVQFRMEHGQASSPMGSLCTVMAPVREGELVMAAGLAGDSEGTYLEDSPSLRIRAGRSYSLYTSDNGHYVGLHKYLPTATLAQNPLAVAVLLPREAYDQYSRRYYGFLAMVLLILLAVVIFSSRWAAGQLAQPLVSGLDRLRQGEWGEPAGIEELDALADFFRQMRDVQNGSGGALPLAIDSFLEEFLAGIGELTPAERGIFAYYAQGMEAGQIPDLAHISSHTVKKHSSNIYRKLRLSSREELRLYVELFRRLGRLEDLGL